jgi:hypothetical protein
MPGTEISLFIARKQYNFSEEIVIKKMNLPSAWWEMRSGNVPFLASRSQNFLDFSKLISDNIYNLIPEPGNRSGILSHTPVPSSGEGFGTRIPGI